MKKKVLGLITAIVIIISAAISVNAAARASSTSLELYTHQYEATSSTITAGKVKIWTKIDSSSAHMVWSIGQYYEGSNYDNKISRYMNIGDELTFYSGDWSTSSWYLELNPTGAFKNCRASGTIAAA